MENVNSLLERLKAQGLDVHKGVAYCGGEESYLEILQSFCSEYEETIQTIQKLFEEGDWKNYIIEVHGAKSAMGSIGAEEISLLAKQLEFAGKEDRLDYIYSNHEEFLKRFRDFFLSLQEIDDLFCGCMEEDDMQEETDCSGLRSLTPEEFGQTQEALERAAYALDERRLMELLNDLKQCEYQGIPCDTVVMKAMKKVEGFDYLSAVEMIQKQWA